MRPSERIVFPKMDARQPLPQIRLSVSMSLGAGQIIFLVGINATENKMLIEGIYLYLFVVKAYNINTKMYMYHVISWAQLLDTPTSHKGDDQFVAANRGRQPFSANTNWHQSMRADDSPAGCHVAIRSSLACA
nr:uncharacterized protein LOC131796617 isoform X2 [Pocillopora verrucosa]XP_058970196.1 uncharacterized protein LOC131796617 isoform X2 [Pocillopora verrucosa]